MLNRSIFCAAFFAGALVAFPAAAQDDATEGVDLTLAPGFEISEAETETEDPKREAVHPFGTREGFGDVGSENQPLNELGGRRVRSERGVIGDALNELKKGVFGR